MVLVSGAYSPRGIGIDSVGYNWRGTEGSSFRVALFWRAGVVRKTFHSTASNGLVSLKLWNMW